MYPAMKLTKFERARIIGARSLQLSMGAPHLIEIPKEVKDPTEIAVLEFKARAVPMTVVRRAAGQDPVVIDINEVDLETMLY